MNKLRENQYYTQVDGIGGVWENGYYNLLKYRCCYHSDACRITAVYGHFRLFKYVYEVNQNISYITPNVNLKIMTYLIEKGYYQRLFDGNEKNFIGVCYRMIQFRTIKLLQLFMNRYQKSFKIDVLLHCAINNLKRKIVKYLLSTRFTISDNSLALSAKNGDLYIVRLIIKHVHSTNRDIEYMLSHSIQYCHYKLTKYLLTFPNTNNKVYNCTYAIGDDHLPVIELLYQHGYTFPNKVLNQIQSQDVFDFLFSVSNYKQQDIDNILNSQLGSCNQCCVAYLIKKGAVYLVDDYKIVNYIRSHSRYDLLDTLAVTMPHILKGFKKHELQHLTVGVK
jgi:hypothetical protein